MDDAGKRGSLWLVRLCDLVTSCATCPKSVKLSTAIFSPVLVTYPENDPLLTEELLCSEDLGCFMVICRKNPHKFYFRRSLTTMASLLVVKGNTFLLCGLQRLANEAGNYQNF